MLLLQQILNIYQRLITYKFDVLLDTKLAFYRLIIFKPAKLIFFFYLLCPGDLIYYIHS